MIKSLLLTSTFLGSLILGLFMADGVVIEDNTPSTLQTGSKKIVEININKGAVTGFAKLQLEIPEGLKAIPVETNGASFTFSSQKAKFIWMSLPSDQSFSVSYYLEAEDYAKGTKVITGVFSYIKENQRIDYDLQSKTVEVLENEVPEGTIVQEEVDYSNLGTDLSCVRSITKITDFEYLVELDVLNADLQGFAKILEEVPMGFTAQADNSDGAVVTPETKTIKFIWFDAPTSDHWSVSYRLTSSSPRELSEVTGAFSYVQDNNPKEIPILNSGEIKEMDPPAIEEEIAENVEKTVEEPEEIFEEDSTDVKNTYGEEVSEPEDVVTEVAEIVEETPIEEVKTTENKATSVPNPNTGVSYRVQIVASHNVVSTSFFNKKYQFNENLILEDHDGWTKYTTGDYSEYKSARDSRERINSRYSFRGPFVTAYNHGERITVQEALMITQQQWYK